MSLDNERFFIEYSDGSGSHRPFKLYYNINEYEISKFWKKCILCFSNIIYAGYSL